MTKPKRKAASKEASSESTSNRLSARRRLVLDISGGDADSSDRSEPVSSPPPLAKNTPSKGTMDAYSTTPSTIDAAFQTPQKKRAAQTSPKPPKVTPDKQGVAAASADYVPTYIHKNVGYERKGKRDDLSETTRHMFELVHHYFVIPENFEQTRAYGPLSGTCYEERVISAYALNLLEPKESKHAEIQLCSFCASEGHRRDACSQLI